MGFLRKASDWLSDMVGGGSNGLSIFGLPSYAGKTVTPENSLTVAALWCCVKILAETSGTLPLGVYKRIDGASQPAPEHPLHELLHDCPNPDMSAADYRMSQTAQLALWGNCYSRIAKSTTGKIVALWPLQSKSMRRTSTPGGESIYTYTAGGNSGEKFKASDILHVRTLSFNGMDGISPIAQMKNPVGLAMALEEFAGRFFGNGAIPAIALEHPARLGPEAVRNIRESWKNLYGGNQNAHEVAVLEENMKIQMIGADPQKSQAIESRRFQIAELARIYRIPLHMLADLERATFSNIEQQSLEFVVYTLMPWLEIWEQSINRSLFTQSERVSYFAEHNVAGLLRGDQKSRYESYAIGKQWGFLNTNMILRLENIPGIGPEGDVYLQPMNMIPLGTTPDPAETSKAALMALAALTRN